MEVRLSEDMAFMEGFNQQVAQSLIFGNEGTAPETFTGFAPRYNSSSPPRDAQNTPNRSRIAASMPGIQSLQGHQAGGGRRVR